MEHRSGEIEVIAHIGEIAAEPARGLLEAELAIVAISREELVAISLEDTPPGDDEQAQRGEERDADEQERPPPHVFL
jgi:hypothetical protein